MRDRGPVQDELVESRNFRSGVVLLSYRSNR